MTEKKMIKLTQGKYAIVDADMYEQLIKYKWHAIKKPNTYYAATSVRVCKGKQKNIFMHRLINETPDGFVTDHVDGNGLNNCKDNLRTATTNQNMHNQKPQENRTSKYKGVAWFKQSKKWNAQIKLNGKIEKLGLFDCEESARDAYIEASKKLHGEFSIYRELRQ